MKPYHKDTGLRYVILGDLLALMLPLLLWHQGRLQSHSALAWISLGLQVIPLANLLRLLMNLTLGITFKGSQLAAAWLLTLGALGSCIWWGAKALHLFA